MYDWLWQIQWIEVSTFLTSGHPSLLFQLAAINCAFIIAVIVMRLRRDPNSKKKRSNFFIQEALLLLNILILSEDYFRPFYYERIEPLIYNFKHQVL